MNRIARTLTTLIVAAGLAIAVAPATASAAQTSVITGNHWCC